MQGCISHISQPYHGVPRLEAGPTIVLLVSDDRNLINLVACPVGVELSLLGGRIKSIELD